MDAKVVLFAIISVYTVLLIGFLIRISGSPTILAKVPVRHTAVARETSPVAKVNNNRIGLLDQYFPIANKSSPNNIVTLNYSTVSNTIKKNITRRILPRAKATREPPKQTRKHYVSCKWHYLDGLGNQMFQYAGVYGIGRANNLTVLMPDFIDMGQRIFTLSAERTTSNEQQPGLNWKKHWTGRECCIFHDDTMVMYKTPNFEDRDIEVRGYRQSWKYFKDYENEIRREFTFQEPIQEKADAFLESAIEQTFGAVNRADVTIVSVHVRRGDMMGPGKAEYGQIISEATYFSRAIDYFNSLLRKSENLMYIVFSDDIEWCMENIMRSDSEIVYSRNNTAEVDLAAMGECDHSIISIGTFGWWGAWLAGGTAVYDKTWPRPGTQLARHVKTEDYFYPGWIPL